MVTSLPFGAIRTIGLVVFPDAELLDISGALNAFSMANRFLQHSGKSTEAVYRLTVLATEEGAIRTSAGLAIIPDQIYCAADDEFHTLIVVGGDGVQRLSQEQAFLAWLRRVAPRCERVVSICTGVFLLAASGLLEHRRVTTHWYYCRQLAQSYPSLQVVPDVIFIRDGPVYTSGGITAGIDLTLALIEEDHGLEVAAEVARFLVVFIRRPGDQSQFSPYLNARLSQRHDLRELQSWIISHPDADLSIEGLAKRVAMSPRNFARIFSQEVGITPAKFVEQVRIEAARSCLHDPTLSLEATALRCGFGHPERMRTAFHRALNVSPQEYRAQLETQRVSR